jgi:DNA-binding NarL/FixJ family response regulator
MLPEQSPHATAYLQARSLYLRAVTIFVQAAAAYSAASTRRAGAARGRQAPLEHVQPRPARPRPPSGSDQLRALARPSRPPQPGGPSLDELTQRQKEVAVLIARGFTNAGIANRLVVTPGTAANHVAQILERLGFSCRAQVAVWAAQQGLLEQDTEPDATER